MHEKGDSQVCREMLDLSDGQGLGLEATWKVTAIGGSYVEMGTYCYVFHPQDTSDGKGIRRDIGYRGASNQERLLSSHSGEFLGREIGQFIYTRDYFLAWYSSLHCN